MVARPLLLNKFHAMGHQIIRGLLKNETHQSVICANTLYFLGMKKIYRRNVVKTHILTRNSWQTHTALAKATKYVKNQNKSFSSNTQKNMTRFIAHFKCFLEQGTTTNNFLGGFACPIIISGRTLSRKNSCQNSHLTPSHFCRKNSPAASLQQQWIL